MSNILFATSFYKKNINKEGVEEANQVVVISINVVDFWVVA